MITIIFWNDLSVTLMVCPNTSAQWFSQAGAAQPCDVHPPGATVAAAAEAAAPSAAQFDDSLPVETGLAAAAGATHSVALGPGLMASCPSLTERATSVSTPLFHNDAEALSFTLDLRRAGEQVAASFGSSWFATSPMGAHPEGWPCPAPSRPTGPADECKTQ